MYGSRRVISTHTHLEERNFTFPRSYSLIEFTDVTSPGSVHLYAEGGADANTRFRLLFPVVSVSIRSCIDPRFTISIDLYEKKKKKKETRLPIYISRVVTISMTALSLVNS